MTGLEFGKSQKAVENMRKLEKNGCKVIYGGLTAVMVKGLMMMVLVHLPTRAIPSTISLYSVLSTRPSWSILSPRCTWISKSIWWVSPPPVILSSPDIFPLEIWLGYPVCLDPVGFLYPSRSSCFQPFPKLSCHSFLSLTTRSAPLISNVSSLSLRPKSILVFFLQFSSLSRKAFTKKPSCLYSLFIHYFCKPKCS